MTRAHTHFFDPAAWSRMNLQATKARICRLRRMHFKAASKRQNPVRLDPRTLYASHRRSLNCLDNKSSIIHTTKCRVTFRNQCHFVIVVALADSNLSFVFSNRFPNIYVRGFLYSRKISPACFGSRCFWGIHCEALLVRADHPFCVAPNIHLANIRPADS